jgi:hypothetical protein
MRLVGPFPFATSAVIILGIPACEKSPAHDASKPVSKKRFSIWSEGLGFLSDVLLAGAGTLIQTTGLARNQP